VAGWFEDLHLSGGDVQVDAIKIKFASGAAAAAAAAANVIELERRLKDLEKERSDSAQLFRKLSQEGLSVRLLTSLRIELFLDYYVEEARVLKRTLEALGKRAARALEGLGVGKERTVNHSAVALTMKHKTNGETTTVLFEKDKWFMNGDKEAGLEEKNWDSRQLTEVSEKSIEKCENYCKYLDGKSCPDNDQKCQLRTYNKIPDATYNGGDHRDEAHHSGVWRVDTSHPVRK